jgi:hypothetical protein
VQLEREGHEEHELYEGHEATEEHELYEGHEATEEQARKAAEQPAMKEAEEKGDEGGQVEEGSEVGDGCEQLDAATVSDADASGGGGCDGDTFALPEPVLKTILRKLTNLLDSAPAATDTGYTSLVDTEVIRSFIPLLTHAAVLGEDGKGRGYLAHIFWSSTGAFAGRFRAYSRGCCQADGAIDWALLLARANEGGELDVQCTIGEEADKVRGMMSIHDTPYCILIFSVLAVGHKRRPTGPVALRRKGLRKAEGSRL